MTDAEAWAHYSKPENQTRGEGPALRPPRMGGAVPIRFHEATIEQIRVLADADGLTVSEWLRRLVEREISTRSGTADCSALELADELERLARRLRSA